MGTYKYKTRVTSRQTDRQTDIQTLKQTGKLTERWKNCQTDRKMVQNKGWIILLKL